MCACVLECVLDLHSDRGLEQSPQKSFEKNHMSSDELYRSGVLLKLRVRIDSNNGVLNLNV